MSNLSTVQGIYESFGKGDVPAILAVLADDVEWEAWADNSAVKAGLPWMTPRHGKEDVVGFFEAAGEMEILALPGRRRREGRECAPARPVAEQEGGRQPGGGRVRPRGQPAGVGRRALPGRGAPPLDF